MSYHGEIAAGGRWIIGSSYRNVMCFRTAEDEELVYLFARELNLKRSVSDLLFERTVSCLGRDGTVDLVGLLGYYSLISMTIKAFDIPPPS